MTHDVFLTSATIESIDYLENQCVEGKESDKTCDYVEYEGKDLQMADLQGAASDAEEVSKNWESVSPG